ncbi:hypothetical protein SprV_0200948300 [Sparganum proliferum]
MFVFLVPAAGGEGYDWLNEGTISPKQYCINLPAFSVVPPRCYYYFADLGLIPLPLSLPSLLSPPSSLCLALPPFLALSTPPSLPSSIAPLSPSFSLSLPLSLPLSVRASTPTGDGNGRSSRRGVKAYDQGRLRTLYRRVETHCSETEDKIAEIQYLRWVFKTNGYPRNFVNRCIRIRDERPNRTDTKSWRALPNVKNVSEAVGRLLAPLGVGVAHRPEATIRRLIMKPKEPLPRLETSGVLYRI